MVAMRNFSSRAANPDKMPMKNARMRRKVFSFMWSSRHCSTLINTAFALSFNCIVFSIFTFLFLSVRF